MENLFSSATAFTISYFKRKAERNNITRAGVVVSATEPFSAVLMSASSPKSQFVQDVNDIAFPGTKGGNLDLALKLVSSSFFQRDANANEILVIVTDGLHSGNREALFNQARQLRRRGVSIYVIGLGNKYDYEVLRGVAGDGNRVRILRSGAELSNPSFVKEISEFTRATPGKFTFQNSTQKAFKKRLNFNIEIHLDKDLKKKQNLNYKQTLVQWKMIIGR